MKITAYSDKISVLPGETLRFMVNCELPTYHAQLVRLVCGDLNPQGPGIKETAIKTSIDGNYAGRKQSIESGSYVSIPNKGPLAELDSFSFVAMIWPTTPSEGTQCIASKWQDNQQSGFAIVIHDGALTLQIGDGSGRVEVFSPGKPLLARQWYFIAVSFESNTGRITLHQEPQVDFPTIKDSAAARKKSTLSGLGQTRAPLMFGAVRTGKRNPRLDHKYNGKIDSPRLVDRALDRERLEHIRHAKTFSDIGTFIGAWDFSVGIETTTVTDIGPHRLDGETVNLPTRGVTGHNWTGASMNWRDVPAQYGAIHFHEDDLYDAKWKVDFELTIPKQLKSGLYAVRLRSEDQEEYVPFAVRPRKGKENKLAFLLPTASYMAYANDRMTTNAAMLEVLAGRLLPFDKYSLFLSGHREYGLSCYDTHSDGSGVCYTSRLRPILNMRPKHMHSLGGKGSSLWQFNADTHITDWLESTGQEFDVITDEDLHSEGLSLLEPYRAIITSTHPEYHSLQMWDAMRAYQNQGGRLVYMGANGWYWKVAFHPELPGVMEVRRNEGGIRTWAAQPGDYYHSFTGEYGGLWRNQGRAPQQILGTGFTAQGFDISAPYERLPDSFNARAQFIFDGVKKDELIGDFGLIGDGAAGLELDRADPALGTPPHALVLATSQGRHTDLYLVVPEELLATVPGLGGTENALVRADMVFYETPNGGAVWSSGSIAWSGSLSHNGYDNNVARITGNILKRFLDPKPLVK